MVGPKKIRYNRLRPDLDYDLQKFEELIEDCEIPITFRNMFKLYIKWEKRQAEIEEQLLKEEGFEIF